MKSTTIKIMLLLTILLFISGQSFAQEQNNENTIAITQSQIEDQRDNFQFKKARVDWWLTITAIIFAFLTFLGGFIAHSLKRDIERQSDKVERELKELKENAREIIKDLKSKREEAKQIVGEMDTFSNKKVFAEKDIFKENATNEEMLAELEQIPTANEYERLLKDALKLFLSKEERYIEAIGVYEKLLKRHGRDMTVEQRANLHYYIAYSQYKQGGKEIEKTNQHYNREADQSYDEAIKFDPSNSRIYRSKGVNYIAIAKKESDKNKKEEFLNQAKETLDKAIRINNKKHQAFYNLGRIYTMLALIKENTDTEKQKKFFQKANENYEAVTIIQPDNLSAHDKMGYVLGRLANIEKDNQASEHLFEKGFEKVRLSAITGGRCYNYARFLIIKNEKEEAFEWFEKAIKRIEDRIDDDLDFNEIDKDSAWDKYRYDSKYQELKTRFLATKKKNG